jgi:hypothetical protein
MFQFSVLYTFSGQLQRSEYIMWCFKKNEEGEDICMAAAGFIFLASKMSKENTRGFFLG